MTTNIHFTAMDFTDTFTKCIKGYHLINDTPIKESTWEDINIEILNATGNVVKSSSNGSHAPGADIVCSLGKFSNKTARYESGNSSFKVSSYRLTRVCSDKRPGTCEEILAEIDTRKNFTHYSTLVRDEREKEIQYDWYLIPSDIPQMTPSAYEWTIKMNKKKDTPTGWKTNTVEGSSMSIQFSMSSQLWMYIHITKDIEKHKVATCTIPKGKKYTYIQLYEKETDSQLAESLSLIKLT